MFMILGVRDFTNEKKKQKEIPTFYGSHGTWGYNFLRFLFKMVTSIYIF
jgi:hypothetical protein